MKVAALIALLTLAAIVSLLRFDYAFGMDFYHYWGVNWVLEAKSLEERNPYRNQERYALLLRRHASAENDARLDRASDFRKHLDLTGTPLCYALFASLWPMPASYSAAVALYQGLQLTLLLSALLLLGRHLGRRPIDVALFALLAVLTDEPLRTDVFVGNVNCIQLFAISLAVVLPGRLDNRQRPVVEVCNLSLYLGYLGGLVLAKPNAILVAAMMALHVACRFARRRVALALPGALLLCALLALWPCWTFGDPAVWRDWLAEIYGGEPGRLLYPVSHGNFATPLLLSQALGTGIADALLGVFGLLAASLAGALLWPRLRRSGAPHSPALHSEDVAAAEAGWRSRAARRAHRAFACPCASASASAGIVLTLALAPLAWQHYFVLALLPITWLLFSPSAGRRSRGLALAAFLLCSIPVLDLARLSPWETLSGWLVAASWTPLWIALLVTLREGGGGSQRPPLPEHHSSGLRLTN